MNLGLSANQELPVELSFSSLGRGFGTCMYRDLIRFLTSGMYGRAKYFLFQTVPNCSTFQSYNYRNHNGVHEPSAHDFSNLGSIVHVSVEV